MITRPCCSLPLTAYQEEIEALKQQLAASLGAVGSSAGAQPAPAPLPPAAAAIDTTSSLADPAGREEKQPAEQEGPAAAAAAVPAAVVSPSTLDERGAPGGTAEKDAEDSSAGAAIALDAGEESKGVADVVAGGRVEAEEEAASGQTAAEGNVDCNRASSQDLGNTQPASSIQQAPEVVVQEKIVERVVVEEKV